MADPEPGSEPVEDGGSRSPGLRAAVTFAGERIQELIDTAERVGEEVRADAELSAAHRLREVMRGADRLLEDRQRGLTRLTESLAAHTDRLEQGVQELVELLRGTLDGLAQVADPEPRETPAVRAPDGAVLRAAQLAVAGKPAGEIERVLRHEFGIADPAPLVDEILSRGSGSPAGASEGLRDPANGGRRGRKV